MKMQSGGISLVFLPSTEVLGYTVEATAESRAESEEGDGSSLLSPHQKTLEAGAIWHRSHQAHMANKYLKYG